MWSSTRIVEVKQPLDHGLQQRLQVSNQKHGDEHGTAQGKKNSTANGQSLDRSFHSDHQMTVQSITSDRVSPAFAAADGVGAAGSS